MTADLIYLDRDPGDVILLPLDDLCSPPKPIPGFNVPLARKVMEHIVENPDEWDQAEYGQRTECGTAFCFAGHTVLLAGHDVSWMECPCGEGAPHFFSSSTTNGESISFVARRQLGLAYQEARELFSGGNTIADLWRLLEAYSDGEIRNPNPDPIVA